MKFDTYISECMVKLNEEAPQQAVPQQTQAPAQPAPAAPAPAGQPQQQAQPAVDLKPRKEELKKKIIAKIDALNDVNAITELEKSLQ